ncbi:hypothetical protein F5B22DRAFT_641149 [Xylaria bambusicola]|uniref:uncharacterized protein n=1 Tax=Xylaria bambusicola TaxID=326684 RepID=UPI00200833FC|nr:uncharacterized protein F5B22DRAFT_641149 [Xylaria bambusicola]KAI0528175.1 hypothetical protein F5B22DRAFT_641149 [Xylaria bambusicola]
MSSVSMNRYWIPHLDINKKVITQELQCYLGPEATVRPYTRQGEDGFLITTPGACLTDEQIDDICLKSKEMWERQAAAKTQQNLEKPLKRPLHQPILISKGSGAGAGSGLGEASKRRNNRRGAVSKRAHGFDETVGGYRIASGRDGEWRGRAGSVYRKLAENGT